MRLIRLNVVLIPTPAVAAQARRLSAAIAKEDGFFMLDPAHSPHISLYMSDYPAAAVSRIRQALMQALKGSRPCALRARSLRRTKRGYVEVRFARTKELGALQERIIAALNPLRENVHAHRENLRQFSAAGRRNTRAFGYPAVGKEFSPHLTLTRLPRPRPLPRTRCADFSFRAEALGIYLVGPHGTARKRLSALRLCRATNQKKSAL